MKPGLILVDIQNDYFPGGRMELVGINDAALKAAELLAVFRENQWPVFHIQHISNREGATFFLPDTSGVEVHDSVKPLPDARIIRKHYPNSFRDTSLHEALQTSDIERVVICGAMSHMCIDATTRAAADLGFNCVVIHDACATRDLEFDGKKIAASEVHGSFMAALGAAYAQVMRTADFLAGT